MSNVIERVTRYELSDEAIGDIIDGAGDFIGYWAENGSHDSVNKFYAITDTDSMKRFTLTYADILEAAVKLATGEESVNREIRSQIAIALQNYDEADLDAEMYDCIIQVACFGELIYG